MIRIGSLPCWLAVAAAAAAGASWAQGPRDPLVSVPAQVKIGIENVSLPGDENMGLVGTTYLVELGHGFSVGGAAYGAISGRRGGLFTVGAAAGWQRRLAGPLTLDLGLYAGGGGGGAAPVGGGLMLRPHADLLWDFGPYLAGVSLSRVRFANGDISSRQLGLVFNAKTDFRYLPRHRIAQPSQAVGRSGVGFDRALAVAGLYKPSDSAVRNNRGPHTADIGYVGMRMERALNEHAYWGVEATGAASGGVGGYAEYLATAGLQNELWPGVLTVGTRAAFGMGGGGDVGVGGGLLLKGSVYGTLHVTPSFGVLLEAGVVKAPQGSFKATSGSASLVWTLDAPNDATASVRHTRMEWVGGVERNNAQRRDGSRRTMQAVVLKVNRYVSPHFYLTGQAHSAYGGEAGGYSVGLIGVGAKTPLWGPVHAGAEAMVGAAGGGGIDTGGGGLAQPMAYLGVDLSPAVLLRVGAGRIFALGDGALDASVVDVSLAFTFGVASREPR
ncbi:hypothetical protein [Piscinibacter sp.]|uniref:hypothetical protein n=1 Tax=Piscinibacter sp. TaxID=1903157 RepID=UPI002BC2B4D6|nr:hypothetical protein [Albitalea sp.]HUG25790.1 hypothetical protein [Albitalea sp.]